MEGLGPTASIRLSALAAALGWTAIALTSFIWSSAVAHHGAEELAVAQARASFRKDLAYRRWAADQGGVYVPVTRETPPNPYLHVKDRDIVSPSGKLLTLVNPAYMSRLVFERDTDTADARARITSARPLRPENRPDPWEASALDRLERGAPEVVEQIEHDAPMLRYMGRLVVEERCLSCHEGYRVGDLRGGISISVPMKEYFEVADGQTLRVGIGHGVVWLLGLCGIAFAASRARRSGEERERERQVREELERELAHARRLEAIGRLAGGVAHDLNNLLSPILGNASLALERVRPGDALHEDLQDIHEAALRARGLTQQLLAFGRKQVLSVEPLDVSLVVEGVTPLLRRLVGSGVELRPELAPGLPAVRADRAQLESVLLNFAGNARDAMPGGGVLRVATSLEVLDEARAARAAVASGRYVAVTVSDTGSGIDAATRARLFEPFFTTKSAGTGLGLASAHGTVRQLGGAIEVDTEEGTGSTFRVLLPAIEGTRTPLPVSRAPAEPAPRGSEAVLLVEDEPAVRRYAAAALESLGYRVLVAADSEHALRIVEEEAGGIDVLVSDVRMPRIGGLELHARISERFPGLPTVFVTGYAAEAVGPETPAPAGAAVVQKPFTPGDLAVAVRRVLTARPRA